MGPFPIAKGQLKFCVVAIDYITKWVEASPLKKIAEEDMKKFFRKVSF